MSIRMLSLELDQIPHPDDAGEAQSDDLIRTITGKLGFRDLQAGRIIYIMKRYSDNFLTQNQCRLLSDPYEYAGHLPGFLRFGITVLYLEKEDGRANITRVHSLYGLGVVPWVGQNGRFLWDNRFFIIGTDYLAPTPS
jgi:hypothetical protein